MRRRFVGRPCVQTISQEVSKDECFDVDVAIPEICGGRSV